MFVIILPDSLSLTRYGPIFRTSILSRPVVVSSDVEFNNYIFQQEGKSVELWYLDTLSKVIGINESDQYRLNSVGALHNYIRSALLKQIGVESLKDKLVCQMEQYFHNALSEWSSSESSIEVKEASLAVSLRWN